MWTKERLFEVQKKTVKILDDDVIIRKLKVGEVLGKDGDEEKSLKMISNSLIEPAMTVEEVKGMPLDFQVAIQKEISEYNGLNAKEAARETKESAGRYSFT